MALHPTIAQSLTSNSVSNSVSQFDPPLQRLDGVLMRLTQLEDRIHGTGPKGVNSTTSDVDAVAGRIDELIGDVR